MENGPTSNPNPGSDGEPFETADFGMKSTSQPGDKANEVKAEEAKAAADDDLWALFGVKPPDFSDLWEQEKAPPVDRELLRRYCQNQLPAEEMDRVARLVVTCETWWNARQKVSVELAREELAREQNQPGSADKELP
jgi:hypothetical protein